MSFQILPYSVAEFNKINRLADSNKEFKRGEGEAFVLSTLRKLLIEHKVHDFFCIRLLHKDSNLKGDEKLVDLYDRVIVWTMGKLPGGDVQPTAWRVLKGQGLMPYEFKYYASDDDDKPIDLSCDRYQPFLRAFVSAVEAAGLCDSVALALRMERYLETNKKYGRREILVHDDNVETEVVGIVQSLDIPEDSVEKNSMEAWWFNPKD